MDALLIWKEPEKRRKSVVIREISILNVRFLCVEILRGPRTPEAVLRRRILSAGRKLRRSGVKKLITPANFSDWELLKKYELQPVSTQPLRRMMAADWACWNMAERALPAVSARVVISAERLSKEVARTVTELCLRHRYVSLKVPHGGEELCLRLRREYGVSLLLNPSKEQMATAETVLLFDEQADCFGPGVLRIYDESQPLPPLNLSSALERALPDGVNRMQILSSLVSVGALGTGQVTIGEKNGERDAFFR